MTNHPKTKAPTSSDPFEDGKGPWEKPLHYIYPHTALYSLYMAPHLYPFKAALYKTGLQSPTAQPSRRLRFPPPLGLAQELVWAQPPGQRRRGWPSEDIFGYRESEREGEIEFHKTEASTHCSIVHSSYVYIYIYIHVYVYARFDLYLSLCVSIYLSIYLPSYLSVQ